MNLKNLISQSIYFSREVHGGKSSEEMFQVLNEKIEKAKEDQPGLSIQFQPFDENHPLLIAIVTPLMKRIHQQVNTVYL